MAVQKLFTVGRASTCDIPIAHDSVSRSHAEIELLDGDRLRVRDLGSQNGTTLIRQGREFPVQRELVFANDTLRFGEVAVAARDVIEIVKAASKPAPAPAGDAAALPEAVAGLSSLVRCGCGAVKARDGRCPVCGE